MTVACLEKLVAVRVISEHGLHHASHSLPAALPLAWLKPRPILRGPQWYARARQLPPVPPPSARARPFRRSLKSVLR